MRDGRAKALGGETGDGCGRGAVHQTAENLEPGDAVGQDMVEDHDQSGLAVTDTGQQGGGPQRTIPPQPGCDQRGGLVEHALLAAGLRAVEDREVLVEVKSRIVHPDRSTATERYVDQPLPQPRNRRQSALQHLGQPCRIESSIHVEHHDRAHLQRRTTALGDQRHQVVGAGALDRVVSPHGLHPLSVGTPADFERASRDR